MGEDENDGRGTHALLIVVVSLLCIVAAVVVWAFFHYVGPGLLGDCTYNRVLIC